MSQVYSTEHSTEALLNAFPYSAALLAKARLYATLKTEQCDLQRAHLLTTKQQERLCDIGSQLDALSESDQETYVQRPWESIEVAFVNENLHHAAWWD